MDDTALISAMPNSLTWSFGATHPTEVLQTWTARVEECLDLRFRSLQRTHPTIAHRLARDLSALSADRRSYVVLAPTMTAVSLPGRRHSPTRWVAALDDALRAESLRHGAEQRIVTPIATARGDVVYCPDGAVIQSPTIRGLPLLDMDSRHACSIDLTGEQLTIEVPRARSAPDVRRVELARLRAAAELLNEIDTSLAKFVRDFTLVLVVQVDSDDERFSSGSHGYFVGRSVLANVHRPGLRPADVVDSLVHEAIHSLLYMQEDLEPWLLDPDLLTSDISMVSPWTGNRLYLRPYLQACFVWYGLTHLWARAASVAPPEDVRRLLVRSSRGFLGDSLTDCVIPYRAGLQSALLDALDEMQARVRDAVTEPA